MRWYVFASGAVMTMAAPAVTAQEMILFTFTDMVGSYNRTSSKFESRSSGAPGILTFGTVSRVMAPTGIAIYGPGLPNDAVQINVDIMGLTPTSATAVGTIKILDKDGDTLQGFIQGDVLKVGAFAEFNLLMSNVFITDGGVPDTTWNGYNGGSFLRTFPAPQPYSGAVRFDFLEPGFFAADFSGVSVQTSGIVVPAPAAFAAFAGAGLLGLRRRR